MLEHWVHATGGDAPVTPLSDEELHHFRSAVRDIERDAQVQARDLWSQPVVLLTQGQVRTAVRSLVEDEFPEVVVLAYEELRWT